MSTLAGEESLWLKFRTLSKFPHLKQRERRTRVPPVILGLGRVAACLRVFLWLCARPCSGCASTAAKDPTRCVLSETPALLPGPGSASNPEAMFAAICGRIHNQIRLITAQDLIRFNKTQTDFAPSRGAICMRGGGRISTPGTTHPSSAGRSWTCPYPGLGSGQPMWEFLATLA